MLALARIDADDDLAGDHLFLRLQSFVFHGAAPF
jgi:hypothetical protein